MNRTTLETKGAVRNVVDLLKIQSLLTFVFCCLALLVMIPSSAYGTSYQITVDTSPISLSSAQLAFDFLDGGPPSNTITISSFATDGTLGSVFPSGGVSGTLPGTVTLTDTSFFNEYLTNITLGTNFSFVLGATTNGPASGSLADAFSIFLLDPATSLPLFPTTDPTGSGSLLTLNIDGSSQGALSTYIATGGEVSVTAMAPVVTTPEPATILLYGSGLAYLAWKRRRKN